ncbi:MAG: cell division protein FtsA [Bacteroidota bacterium]
MENSELIVGLDIGTTKIAVIVGRKDKNGNIEILGSGKAESTGVMRGQVANIEKTVTSIRTAVEMAERESGVEIGSVVVGIAGQHIKSIQHRGNVLRDNTVDEISKKDIIKLTDNMKKLVMKPGEQIIDVIPQEFIIDRETGIREPIGMAGVELGANFHIITGNESAIKNIYRCVVKAGLELEALVLEPLASSESVLSDEEKEAGVVLVDIGGGTSDIAIFQDNIIRHTAVIPLGGNTITEDVKEGCTIIKVQAEALKVKYGSCLAEQNRDDEIVSIPGLKGRPPKEISLRNLAHIIQARVEEIVEQIDYEIQNSGYKKKLIAGIVLTGGGSQLKHLKELVEFTTGMEARIGAPSEKISPETNKDLLNPSYATSIGLVIEGFNRHIPKAVEPENEFVNSTSTEAKVKKEKPKKPPRDISNTKLSDMLKGFFGGEEVK